MASRMTALLKQTMAMLLAAGWRNVPVMSAISTVVVSSVGGAMGNSCCWSNKIARRRVVAAKFDLFARRRSRPKLYGL